MDENKANENVNEKVNEKDLNEVIKEKDQVIEKLQARLREVDERCTRNFDYWKTEEFKVNLMRVIIAGDVRGYMNVCDFVNKVCEAADYYLRK